MVASTLGGGKGPPSAPTYQKIYYFIIIKNMHEILPESTPFDNLTYQSNDTIWYSYMKAYMKACIIVRQCHEEH